MEYLDKYGYTPDSEAIAESLQELSSGLDGLQTPEVLMQCFAAMDITTLRSNDTPSYVKSFVEKVNGLAEAFPDYPSPASVCVFPNYAGVVSATRRDPSLHVTCVSSCFPSTQSFLEVKVRECELAVRGGADEIDIVLALGKFLDGDYEAAYTEIVTMKNAIAREAAACGRRVVLKVILETGLLGTPENIARASFLAMEAGADFIKTSTGKVAVNATPEAAYVMCECIRRYYERTGRKVGFKAAGGVSTAREAALYYGIVLKVLGQEWTGSDLFRLGVSRLGNNLISAIEHKEVAYF